MFTMIKVLRNSKTEHVMLLTLLKSISSTFFRNELKSIKHNNSFMTHRRNAEIIKKKRIWKLFRKRDNKRISRIFWSIWWKIRKIVVSLLHKSMMRQDKINHTSWIRGHPSKRALKDSGLPGPALGQRCRYAHVQLRGRLLARGCFRGCSEAVQRQCFNQCLEIGPGLWKVFLIDYITHTQTVCAFSSRENRLNRLILLPD